MGYARYGWRLLLYGKRSGPAEGKASVSIVNGEGEGVAADVCIIGAGPAGLVLALELQAHGVRVCLVESGTTGLSRRGNELSKGENADRLYYVLQQSRRIGFGGSSLGWDPVEGPRMRPLDPIDFEARAAIPHSGWPFGAADLDDHYKRAADLLSLPPFPHPAEVDLDQLHRHLPLGPDVATTVFQFGEHDAIVGLLEQVGSCERIDLRLQTAVLELLTSADGTRLEGVLAVDADGRPLRIDAPQVVLAAGGIENARLLMLSRRHDPRGIGNDHDLLGRFFMEHLHARTGIVRLDEPLPLDEFSLYLHHRPAPGEPPIRGKIRLAEDVLRREGLPNTVWWMNPSLDNLLSDSGRALVDLRESVKRRRVAAGTGERVQVVATHPLRSLRAYQAGVARRRKGVGSHIGVLHLHLMAEQVPNPESRVLLGRRHDRFGRPVARLDWQLSERDLWGIRRTQELLDEAFRAAGLGRVEQHLGEEAPPALLGGGHHHMGTTRMSTDPSSGVVDADGRVHGVENLFVTGSSVFPTGGSANPTLTILAMAYRLADHLLDARTG